MKFRPISEMTGGETGVEGLGMVTRLTTGPPFVVEASGATRRNRIPSDCVFNGCGRPAVDFFAFDHWPGMNAVAIIPVCADHSGAAYASVFGEAEGEVAR